MLKIEENKQENWKDAFPKEGDCIPSTVLVFGETNGVRYFVDLSGGVGRNPLWCGVRGIKYCYPTTGMGTAGAYSDQPYAYGYFGKAHFRIKLCMSSIEVTIVEGSRRYSFGWPWGKSLNPLLQLDILLKKQFIIVRELPSVLPKTKRSKQVAAPASSVAGCSSRPSLFQASKMQCFPPPLAQIAEPGVAEDFQDQIRELRAHQLFSAIYRVSVSIKAMGTAIDVARLYHEPTEKYFKKVVVSGMQLASMVTGIYNQYVIGENLEISLAGHYQGVSASFAAFEVNSLKVWQGFQGVFKGFAMFLPVYVSSKITTN